MTRRRARGGGGDVRLVESGRLMGGANDALLLRVDQVLAPFLGIV